MAQGLILAIDAMGGDQAPDVTVAGAELFLAARPDASVRLHGDEAQLKPLLSKPSERIEIVHTDLHVTSDMKPSQALRRGKGSSMWNAIHDVKDGHASAAVSAGNTGALMAMAKICLRTVASVDRPAIAALWPTVRRETVVLDVGANVGADATQLVDNAVMGAAMARALFSKQHPVIGLLNVGVEEIKGLDEIKKAAAILRACKLPFEHHGFVEGDDLGQGLVDVVVTEGFSGNIALKTAEGTAKQIGTYLRGAMGRTILTRIGAAIASGGFKALKLKMDPRGLNGGVFLGLNGLVIKSHGGTDGKGFASAIDLGYDMASNNLVKHLASDIERFHKSLYNEHKQNEN